MIDPSDEQVRRLTYIIEQIVTMIHRDEADDPCSAQTEYARGGLWAAKWVISSLFGDRAKDRVLGQVRRRTGKPIPHIVGLPRTGTDMVGIRTPAKGRDRSAHRCLAGPEASG